MAIPGILLRIQNSYLPWKPNFIRIKIHILEARLNDHFLNYLLFLGAKEKGVRRHGGANT